MKFSYLLLREWKWWLASPALWWSLPVVIFVIFLYFPIIIQITGLKIPELEEMWKVLSQMWFMFVKPMFKDAMTFFPKDQLETIEGILKMTPEQLWQSYLIPPLKVFILIPTAYLITPLGIRILQRDLQNGFIIQHLSHRGSIMHFFAAKWLLNTLVLAFIQLAAMLLFLNSMAHLTAHPDFFKFSDPDWLITWFGVSLGLASSSLWLSWISFLLSRNGVTEFYISILLSLSLLLGIFALLKNVGLDRQGLIIASGVVWCSNLLYFFIMSWTVKRERFWLT